MKSDKKLRKIAKRICKLARSLEVSPYDILYRTSEMTYLYRDEIDRIQDYIITIREGRHEGDLQSSHG